MPEPNLALLADVVLALVLLVYLGEGLRNGLGRSLSVIAGIAVGGVAAYFLIPPIAAAVPSPEARTPVLLALSLALLAAGHVAGHFLGKWVTSRERGVPVWSRVAGGVANVAGAVLVLSLVAGGVAALGVPVVTAAANDSTVLRAIRAITPPPVEAALARVRASVLEPELPSIDMPAEQLPSPQQPGGSANPAPEEPTDGPSLAVAERSVVRISGVAYACGQNQTGTGWVVARGRVLTNAHVVAGVSAPIVEAGGRTAEGRVVYFSAVDDLAVIAVDLDAPPLAIGGLSEGDSATVAGYPYGGPFVAEPARIAAVSSARVKDIYGGAGELREVYTLSSTVEPGDSGGPLLTDGGLVAGIVFARAKQDGIGYAMTATEFRDVAGNASGYRESVAPGHCSP